MNWRSFWQSLITHILAFAIGMAVDHFFIASCPEPEIIDLTEQEREQIIQEARFGYITEDSAKALILSESKINWIDSVVIRVKDSVNVRDSIIFIPYFESPDTLITLLDSSGYLIRTGLKQRFFPLQKKFASDLWLNTFTTPAPPKEKAENRSYERYRLSFGVGARLIEYANKNADIFYYVDFSYYPFNSRYFDIETSISGEYGKDGLNPGIKLGLGVKY